jgi:hypothetical protein
MDLMNYDSIPAYEEIDFTDDKSVLHAFRCMFLFLDSTITDMILLSSASPAVIVVNDVPDTMAAFDTARGLQDSVGETTVIFAYYISHEAAIALGVPMIEYLWKGTQPNHPIEIGAVG